MIPKDKIITTVALLPVAMFICMCAFAGCGNKSAASAITPPSRFVKVSSELDDDTLFEVWNDTLMHREIVCAYSKLAAPSCFETGRIMQ